MVKDKIQKQYASLTPGLKKVADFITENTINAAFLTEQEVADLIGVELETIKGFCQEIGFSSYQELSKTLRTEMYTQAKDTHQITEEQKNEVKLLHALYENLQKNLHRAFINEMTSVAEAVKILSQATHIWLVGEYTYYLLAQFLAANFAPVNIPATAFRAEVHESASAISQMDKGDALIALAFGQAGIDTGYTVKLAKEKGIKTICLGNSREILPAKEADISIIDPPKSDVNIASFDSSLLLCSFLVEAVATTRVSIEETLDHFIELHENMGTLLDMRVKTKKHDLELPKDR